MPGRKPDRLPFITARDSTRCTARCFCLVRGKSGRGLMSGRWGKEVLYCKPPRNSIDNGKVRSSKFNKCQGLVQSFSQSLNLSGDEQTSILVVADDTTYWNRFRTRRLANQNRLTLLYLHERRSTTCNRRPLECIRKDGGEHLTDLLCSS